MVTAAEAAEVKSLASKAKSGDGFDFSKLPADAAERLEALYAAINAKVGRADPPDRGRRGEQVHRAGQRAARGGPGAAEAGAAHGVRQRVLRAARARAARALATRRSAWQSSHRALATCVPPLPRGA